MNYKIMVINRRKSSIFLMIILCFGNLISIGARAKNQKINNQSNLIKIEQGEIPLFGGIQSIRATIGESTIGVLYGSTQNPQPIYLFTEFSQKIATVQIFNFRGILEKEIELKVQNLFVFRLDAIVEFSDRNNDGLYSVVQDRFPKKMVNLSAVSYQVSKSSNDPSPSEEYLRYMVNFTARNISYQEIMDSHNNSTLDCLCFYFELTIEQNQVNISNVPIVSIYPRRSGFNTSITDNKGSLPANRVIPRLKFSCNIVGWDYSSSKSKLLLKTTLITHEQIVTSFGRVSGKEITRETLKSTNIFSKLAFNIEQGGKAKKLYLDQNENRTNEYSAQRLRNLKISLGNRIRNFLNFSWSPNLNVDGTDYSATFQLITSGEANFQIDHSTPLTSLYLIGGFVFPQGAEIFYDPEVQFEEINPIFSLPMIPNRSILEESSLIVLISGFFVGTLIVFRQIFNKRK
ncbi:MAG: hypothetical protein ACFFFH_18345 [Candidatus Thorarchaeota archaeon]